VGGKQIIFEALGKYLQRVNLENRKNKRSETGGWGWGAVFERVGGCGCAGGGLLVLVSPV
jgi:hypothetical protein